jgi:hypothetical protein
VVENRAPDSRVEELNIYDKHFSITSRYGTLSGTIQAG